MIDLKNLVLLFVVLSACAPASAPVSKDEPGRLSYKDGNYHIKIFPDGSGSVALGPDVLDFAWRIDCRVDAMSDNRKCNITSGRDGIFVYYGESQRPRQVCVSGHDFPGRRGMIRVNTGSPVNTDTDGCVQAGSLLSQLRTGTSVTTRRVEWPYDYPVDATTTLAGFSKAMEVVEGIRSGTLGP
ncbi:MULTISPECIES: hypothetical protein [unclassified Marinovum]|uniref:hypothetical protein n=1 Tax=unclassified Marinovum TaxID=2647166 RepID=UPI003EDC200F